MRTIKLKITPIEQILIVTALRAYSQTLDKPDQGEWVDWVANRIGKIDQANDGPEVAILRAQGSTTPSHA